jgi:HK97 family phage major capsid protein
MSNRWQQIADAATFDRTGLKAGLREVVLERDPEMLAELKRRGFRWRDVFNNRVGDASFERACSNETIRSADVFQASSAHSVFVPWEAFGYGTQSRFGSLLNKRDATDYITGGVSAGGAFLEQFIPDQSPIDPLRPVSAMLSRSTVVMSKRNNLLIPRVSALESPLAGSGETTLTSVTSGFQTEQCNLTAINYSTSLTISKQILEQASDREIESYVVGLLGKSVGQQIDYLSLYGNGSANQMLGLFNMAANPSNTAPSTYDPSKLCPSWSYGGTGHSSLAQAVRYMDNGDYEDSLDDRVWIISPATRQNWSQTLQSGNSTFFIYNVETGKVLEYKAITTNKLSGTNQSVLIDFRESVFMFIGSGVEMIVNPYTYATSGQCVITVNYFAAFSMFRGGASVSSNACNGSY